jgi:hypothetical protein
LSSTLLPVPAEGAAATAACTTAGLDDGADELFEGEDAGPVAAAVWEV